MPATRLLTHLRRAALAFSLPLLAMTAAAQGTYPSKPIRLVVPAVAGSAADTVARLMTERLSKMSPQPWVVDNRPGAGGTIGADTVAKSAADGHTLLFTANNFIIAPRLFASVPYDIYKDFTPIAPVATGQDMIFVNAALGVKSLKDLAALSKRMQGGINYGAPFLGSSAHLIMEMLGRQAGIDLAFIPASGGPQSFTEAIAGRVPVVIGSSTAGLGFVKTGQLAALAVVDARRSSLLPDVPTLKEEGFAALNLPFWFGVYGPAKLPAAVVEQVNRSMVQVLGSAEFAEALASRGYAPRPGTPAELEALMRDGEPVFAKAIAAAGIKPQ